jgi:hypothetical protein
VAAARCARRRRPVARLLDAAAVAGSRTVAANFAFRSGVGATLNAATAAVLAPVRSAAPAPQLGLHSLANALVVLGHEQQLDLDV